MLCSSFARLACQELASSKGVRRCGGIVEQFAEKLAGFIFFSYLCIDAKPVMHLSKIQGTGFKEEDVSLHDKLCHIAVLNRPHSMTISPSLRRLKI